MMRFHNPFDGKNWFTAWLYTMSFFTASLLDDLIALITLTVVRTEFAWLVSRYCFDWRKKKMKNKKE